MCRTIDKVKEKMIEMNNEQLFTLDAEYGDRLKIGEVNRELNEVFKEKGYPLSNQAKIVKIFAEENQEKKCWVIEDISGYLLVKHDKDELRVYKYGEGVLETNSTLSLGGRKSQRCDGNCEDCDLRESFLC